VVVLRALLATWRDYDEKSAWYRTWFLPSVIADHVAAARSDVERELLTDLRAAMTERQWRALPENVARVAKDSAATIAKARTFQDSSLLAGVRRSMSGATPAPPPGATPAPPPEASVADAVLEWAREEHPEFRPTSEQAAVIGATHGHALVEARAGSGKTTTMIARAAHLIERRGVRPDEILMLAFNSAAAADLRRRAEEWLPAAAQPHIMTLDALAYRLVRPAERVLAEDADRRVEEIVRSLWHDPASQDEMRELVLSFVRADADGETGIRYWSLRGDALPTRAAQSIADALLRSGLGSDGRDFRFHRSSSVFELLDADGGSRLRIAITDPRRPFSADLRYDERTTAESGFEERLRRDLRAAGVPTAEMDDDRLWEAIRGSIGERLLRAITQIVMRARQRMWSGADLLREWRQRDGDESRRGAIELGARMLDLYAQALAEAHEEDFPGIVWRAAARVGEGFTDFSGGGRSGDVREITHIVIDEFQDFTPRFDALIQAVLGQAPRARVMAVGDDWQAINEFAGSSTEYFAEFTARFPGAIRLRMLGNQRSSADIVDVGNSIMAGRGRPAKAVAELTGRIRQFGMDGFEPTPEEERLGRPSTSAVLRLVKEHLGHGRTVAVLARTREVAERAVAGLARVVPPDAVARCDVGTIHSYKGREADAVILVGVAGWAFPHVHPTWQLGRVFGDSFASILTAERRLLYVGVSRPRRWLDVVTGREDDPSPLWESSSLLPAVRRTDWASVAPALGAPAVRRATVRVYNGMYDGRWLLSWDDFHESKNLLTADGGFRYEPSGGRAHWVARMDAAELKARDVLDHPWARFDGIRVEVEWPDRRRQVFTR
jgi:DNA helicase-4